MQPVAACCGGPLCALPSLLKSLVLSSYLLLSASYCQKGSLVRACVHAPVVELRCRQRAILQDYSSGYLVVVATRIDCFRGSFLRAFLFQLWPVS